MGGKSSDTQRVVNKPLKEAMPLIQTGIDDVLGLYNSGQLTPQPFGPRLAPESAQTLAARQGMTDTAMAGNGITAPTQQAYLDMVGSDPYARLDTLRENVLREAVPAAAQYFQNSGMLNSSVAGEGIGEAAARALAPVEYGTFNDMQNRRLQAMSMAPQMAGLSYFDNQILSDVGRDADRRSQQELADQAALYYETQDRPYQDIVRMSDLALGYGGMGGTSKSVAQHDPGWLEIMGGMMPMMSMIPGLFKG